MLKHVAVAVLLLVPAVARAQEKDSFIVPFETKQNLILVKGQIGELKDLTFILDTGASVSVITPKYAKKAGISRNGMLSQAENVGAGDAVVESLQCAIMDPPQAQFMRTGMGVDYAGILGYTYLNQFVTTFDYKKKQLTFTPKKSAAKLEAEAKDSWLCKFKLVNNIIMVEGMINGKGPYSFIFDSGASETIMTPETAEELELKGEKVQSSFGNVQQSKVDSITCGDAEVKGLKVFVLDPPQAQPLKMMGAHYHGILGAPFLRRFLITLDYRAKRIRLTLNSGEPEPEKTVETPKAATPADPAKEDLKSEILKRVQAMLDEQRRQTLHEVEKILDERLKSEK
jgi:hypothetical protein